MKRRFRLLPLVIFAALATLTLKVGTIWQDLNPIGLVSASAAAGDPKAAETEEKIVDAAAAPAETGGRRETESRSSPDAAPASPAETGGRRETESEPLPESSGVDPTAFDPMKATDAELEVLEKLAARRAVLGQRARDLDLRESLLQATEARLDAKIAELKEIKKTIEGLLATHDAEQEAKLQSLVKIYESMKPKDAAQIFEKLEMDVVLDVVERMRAQRTAPIMARMSPAKAEAVTAALVARRALPDVAEKPSESKAN